MVLEEFSRHGRMAPPTEKGNIGPEFDVGRSVHCGIGYLYMTDEAYRLVINVPEPAIFVQHNVRINLRELLPVMAFKTWLPPVAVWPSSEKFGGF
jgi:hypothetical protein